MNDLLQYFKQRTLIAKQETRSKNRHIALQTMSDDIQEESSIKSIYELWCHRANTAPTKLQREVYQHWADFLKGACSKKIRRELWGETC